MAKSLEAIIISKVKRAKELYQVLLAICHKTDIKVRHRQFHKKNYDSIVDMLARKIYIESKLAHTIRGCFILAHEMGHIKDFSLGKFLKFYLAQPKSLPDTPSNRKLIERAEWSASLFARKILLKYNIEPDKVRIARRSYFKRQHLPLYYSLYLKSREKHGKRNKK